MASLACPESPDFVRPELLSAHYRGNINTRMISRHTRQRDLSVRNSSPSRMASSVSSSREVHSSDLRPRKRHKEHSPSPSRNPSNPRSRNMEARNVVLQKKLLEKRQADANDLIARIDNLSDREALHLIWLAQELRTLDPEFVRTACKQLGWSNPEKYYKAASASVK